MNIQTYEAIKITGFPSKAPKPSVGMNRQIAAEIFTQNSIICLLYLIVK